MKKPWVVQVGDLNQLGNGATGHIPLIREEAPLFKVLPALSALVLRFYLNEHKR